MQEPLLFFSCCYADLHFRTTKEGASSNLEAINGLLNQHLSRVALLQTMAAKVRTQLHKVPDAQGNFIPWRKTRRHVQLEKRGREKSLEQKFARFGKVLLHPPAMNLNDEEQALTGNK